MQTEVSILGITEERIFADVTVDAIQIDNTSHPITAGVAVDVAARHGHAVYNFDCWTFRAERDDGVLKTDQVITATDGAPIGCIGPECTVPQKRGCAL